jgi:hypothetical protein
MSFMRTGYGKLAPVRPPAGGARWPRIPLSGIWTGS